MFRSWRIGTVFGIGIYLHWSFLLLPLWVLFGQSDVGTGLFFVGLTLAMFGCVALHELGHALAAKFFGIRTRDITLYPIGGVARLERMSEKPGEEVAIAVAGPAVNVVIAIGLGILCNVGLVLAPAFLTTTGGQFLFLLMMLNIGMVAFNLVPAFPMDGGRVLRALLALPLGRLKATRVAAWVTTVLAILGGVFGVVVLGSPWLPVIAVIIFLGAQQELQMVEMREQLRRAEPIPEVEPYPAARSWPVYQLEPSVAVYVWDNEAGIWVKQRSG